MCYIILSQYFKNAKIAFGGETRSLRLSFAWISLSRSGKGQLCKITELIANGLGLKVTTESDITDAGLIGTIDANAIEFNFQNNLKEGDEKYRNPVIYGDIFNYDIIFFKECKKLLIPTPNTQMLLSVLQEALDDPGYVRKKLRSIYPIEGFCSCSIVATTYYMPEIEKTLLDQGFFMRVPLYCRTFSVDEIYELRKGVIDLFSKNVGNVSMEEEIKMFCDEIKSIGDREVILTLDPVAVRRLNELNNGFYLLMKKTAGSKLEILKSISQTSIDLCIKIGGIHACLDKKTEISEKHILAASIFVKTCVDTILTKINIADAKEKDYKPYISEYKLLEGKAEHISKDFLAQSMKRRNIGRNCALKTIQQMINSNYFSIEKGERNIQYLLLNQELS